MSFYLVLTYNTMAEEGGKEKKRKEKQSKAGED